MLALKFTNPSLKFDSETTNLAIQLVQKEKENTTGLPKSCTTLEWVGLYLLFQGHNTVCLTGTTVKTKYLHENSTAVRDFTLKCHINISSYPPKKSKIYPFPHL